MNGISSDSTKLLMEKLALSRELVSIKPELEHLRSQALYQQTVLAEKLALQRQVSTLEVELETEKRASKRAAQKPRNSEKEFDLQTQLETAQKELSRGKREIEKMRKEMEVDFQSQLDDVQKELTRERREKDKFMKGADLKLQSQLEELQVELAKERRGKEKARKNMDSELQNRLEELEQDLAKEKRENEKARKGADLGLQSQLEETQKELAIEKREREKAHKETEKDLKASENRMAILESKLEQMRTKLRSVKEQLKECQTELGQAQVRLANPKVAPTIRTDVPAKSRKRLATEMDDDVLIGTPDGVAKRGKRPAVKRGRMDHMVGEKSMFSITPFLNRTTSIAPDTPGKESEEEDVEEDEQMENMAKEMPPPQLDALTPTAAPKPKKAKKLVDTSSTIQNNVLGESKLDTKNKKPPAKKPKAVSTLEKVTEEEPDENEEPAPVQIDIGKPTAFTAGKLQLKNAEPEGLGPTKKKRKLVGGAKTLFDEEDGEATKRPAKVALGKPRLLGKTTLGGPKGGFTSGGLVAKGFGAFSPLKKDRRGIGASFIA